MRGFHILFGTVYLPVLQYLPVNRNKKIIKRTTGIVLAEKRPADLWLDEFWRENSGGNPCFRVWICNDAGKCIPKQIIKANPGGRHDSLCHTIKPIQSSRGGRTLLLGQTHSSGKIGRFQDGAWWWCVPIVEGVLLLLQGGGLEEGDVLLLLLLTILHLFLVQAVLVLLDPLVHHLQPSQVNCSRYIINCCHRL